MESTLINLEQLKRIQEKPAPFTPGERLFWDDPHISAQLLAAHLDPNSDLASRRPETIERSVAWLVEILGLQAGDALLDLGCGPGLYAARFAQRGISVTGVDFSQRSIDYAIKYAQQHRLEIHYRYQNYLDLDYTEVFDVAVLIYGDFCTLFPPHRRQLLQNVYRALKPGGHFVLDVTTRIYRQRHGSVNRWSVAENGFWKPGLHLVLEDGFDYPELSLYLDQYSVIEADGRLSVYRMWYQDYTCESITNELENGGFKVRSVWSDLAGSLFTDNSEWIGVLVQKHLLTT